MSIDLEAASIVANAIKRIWLLASNWLFCAMERDRFGGHCRTIRCVLMKHNGLRFDGLVTSFPIGLRQPKFLPSLGVLFGGYLTTFDPHALGYIIHDRSRSLIYDFVHADRKSVV